MPLLSELTVRLLHPANYRFTSDLVQAVRVGAANLEDRLIDFPRFKPDYRPVTENDLLQLNDVVVGLGVGSREVTSVGIYHSGLPSPEAVTLGSFTVAFRAHNLAEAASILAGLIYRLDRRRNLELSEVRTMPITLLSDEQVPKFLAVIKTVHDLRNAARQREKLLQELIPSVIHKFFKDNETNKAA
jgi:hypothetical protein